MKFGCKGTKTDWNSIPILYFCNFGRKIVIMQFKDVIGQDAVKQKLIMSVRENRVPHAQLFLGSVGSGTLPLALAYAQYIMCPNRTATDSCGVCPSCQKINKLVHPDMHFVFPSAANKRVKKDPESDLFLEEWRTFVLASDAYADAQSWFRFLDIENKQGYISVRDAASLQRKLNLKAYEGEFKVGIIWMAEKMRTDTANKLLKLLEEPSDKTVFILVAEDQDELLATIRSRTVMVKIPSIASDALQETLVKKLNCSENEAHDATMIAEGDWIAACRYVDDKDDEKFFFQTFQQWMRLCFVNAMGQLIDFAGNIKTIGRERQKELLSYGLKVVRNAMLVNNHLEGIVMLPNDEKAFVTKFAPFVNSANIIQINELLEESINQIERNGNAQLIFLDDSFKLVKLLRMK